MEPNRCPDSNSPVFEVGYLSDYGLPHLLKFIPSCGLVWSRLDPLRLRSFIERYGTSEAKRALVRVSKPQSGDDLV